MADQKSSSTLDENTISFLEQIKAEFPSDYKIPDPKIVDFIMNFNV